MGRFGMENKVIWLTGASSGIGRELAVLLRAMRARLVLSARNADALVELQEQCGGTEWARVLPLDLMNVDGLQRCVAEARELFGRIDCLICNAGVSQRSRAIETNAEVLQRLVTVNFVAPAELARQVARDMVASGGGAIVAVSSLAGYVATPLRSGYAASKHALHGYFDALRAELVGSNVSVTLAVPGFIRTEISTNALTGDGRTYDHMDENQARGMSPQRCAIKIIRAIATRKREAYIGLGVRGWLALALRKLAPGILAGSISRAKVT